ncbi:MAG: DUF3791 domain-containing protein [Eggerthellaceae bacterium]|nr:DUF3791 domain-containing protein [Eggerthellaceae bacterium]
MTEEMKFFIYLLENYAAYRQMAAMDVYTELQEHGLIEHVYDMYTQYHAEAIENAFDDMDRLLDIKPIGY